MPRKGARLLSQSPRRTIGLPRLACLGQSISSADQAILETARVDAFRRTHPWPSAADPKKWTLLPSPTAAKKETLPTTHRKRPETLVPLTLGAASRRILRFPTPQRTSTWGLQKVAEAEEEAEEEQVQILETGVADCIWVGEVDAEVGESLK